MKQYSVMLIDDNEEDRYLLRRMLNKNKMSSEVFEMTDGKSALDFLSNYQENSIKHPDDFPPMLIFLDINMPIMNGFEFLEAFSKLMLNNDGYSSSVFVMFTSSERDEDKEKVSTYDFVKGYVVKGELTAANIRGTIEGYLE